MLPNSIIFVEFIDIFMNFFISLSLIAESARFKS